MENEVKQEVSESTNVLSFRCGHKDEKVPVLNPVELKTLCPKCSNEQKSEKDHYRDAILYAQKPSMALHEMVIVFMMTVIVILHLATFVYTPATTISSNEQCSVFYYQLQNGSLVQVPDEVAFSITTLIQKNILANLLTDFYVRGGILLCKTTEPLIEFTYTSVRICLNILFPSIF